MVNRKEVFLVLLGLLLLFIQDVVAVEEASQYAEIYISFEDKWGCNNDNDNIDEVRPTYTQCEPPKLGCVLHSYNSDSFNRCAEIVPGLIITQYYQENLFCGDGNSNKYENALYSETIQSCEDTVTSNSYSCSHAISGKLTKNLPSHNIKTQDGFQYLCSDNHYWKQCSEENENKIAWANNILYKCTINEESNSPEWIKTMNEDLDHDGYAPADGDCDDDFTGDPESCPTSLKEQECDPPQHSTCAICINPGRPEVCGDKINNDCGGSNEPISQLEGKTSDNCNKFAAGCEQKSFHDLNIEQESNEAGTTSGNAEDNDNDNEGEVDINTIRHFNAQGESFSWTATADGGYCCGFKDVEEDLGKTVYSEAGGGYRVCLNTEEKLVGREGEIPSCDGDGEWCWATASSNKFHILTIKKHLKQPYDLVSNSQNWLACNDLEAGPAGEADRNCAAGR